MSFEGIQRAIEKLGYSQEYDADYDGHFRFAKEGTEAVMHGADVREAYKVTPGYKLNNPWFEYHEDDGLYYRFQYGGPHMGSEGQIAVKNIIIQYCPAAYYASTEYRNINVQADTWGYYISNGQVEDITCEKDGEFGVTHYYDASGNEITLNRARPGSASAPPMTCSRQKSRENKSRNACLRRENTESSGKLDKTVKISRYYTWRDFP